MKSAVIVSYKDLGFIEENLKLLKGFDVVVAVDNPNDDLKNVIRKYGVKSTICERRRGKWKALNDAIKLVDGDYILFLDSDTKIVELGELNGYDAVEIRKEAEGSSLIAKLVNIDYFIMYLTSKIALKFKSCLSLSGSAFWIKKEVLEKVGGFRKRINEDTDLGVRLGLRGYKICLSGRALTKVPSSFKEWLVQRERWSLGGAEVIVENFFEIIKRPMLWIPYLFMFYPTIVGLMLYLAMPDSIILKILYLILPLLTFLPSKVLSITLLAIFSVHTIKDLIVATFPFIIWTFTVLILSKKMRYRLSYRLLPLYYFLYSPLWTMICLTSFVRVVFTRLRGKSLFLRDWTL